MFGVRPTQPGRTNASAPGTASPEGGWRRARAPPASRSHWLRPVANPRDRRRRAPPRAPPLRAPARPRVPAGGAGRPEQPALRRPPCGLPPPQRPTPTRWQCRAVCTLVGVPQSRAGRPVPAHPSCKSFTAFRHAGCSGSSGPFAAFRFRGFSGRCALRNPDDVALCPQLRESGLGPVTGFGRY